MNREAYDVVVVGGGIVGLATAYQLTCRRPGLRLLVLEKERQLGTHQTGHNSGVVHSGLYYPPGSRKARYAVEGARRTVDFCREHGLPVEVTGKVVVATSAEELPRLDRLYERGLANGVRVTRLGPDGIREHEPYARGVAGLHVPDTAICDYTAVAAAYGRLAEKAGAEIRTGSTVTAVSPGLTVHTDSGEVHTRLLVGCAGLHSDRLAKLAGAEPEARILPFRGEYRELVPGRRHLVRALVYPVPDPAFPFLGVHLTRGVDGSVHVGPNAVPALRREGYRWRQVGLRDLAGTLAYPGFWRLAKGAWQEGVQELRRSVSPRLFAAAARRLVPDLADDDLRPAGAGVRAQAVSTDGRLVDDFLVTETPTALHVLNAPSPAATAALPIGAELATRICARLDG
ncbi:MAG: L-2-hydroxyglutarate oxidase [Mycobacteriales bacterium]